MTRPDTDRHRIAVLQQRLERARRRAGDATPYSPEWAAAMGAVDEVTAELEGPLARGTLET